MSLDAKPGRPDPRNKRNDAQKVADRILISSMRARGALLSDIVVAVNDPARQTGYTLSRSQVHLDWKKAREEWRSEYIAVHHDHAMHELCGMQDVEREAWKAWEGSKRASVQKFVSKETDPTGLETHRQTVKSEDQDGDPRYLEVIGGVRRDRIKLLGLDAPTLISINTTAISALVEAAKSDPVAIDLLRKAEARMRTTSEERNGVAHE